MGSEYLPYVRAACEDPVAGSDGRIRGMVLEVKYVFAEKATSWINYPFFLVSFLLGEKSIRNASGWPAVLEFDDLRFDIR